MGNDNKNTIYVEANAMNIMQSFSFVPLMASEKKIFEYFFHRAEYLYFMLPVIDL